MLLLNELILIFLELLQSFLLLFSKLLHDLSLGLEIFIVGDDSSVLMLSLFDSILDIVDLFVVAVEVLCQLLVSSLNAIGFLFDDISVLQDYLVLVLGGIEQLFGLSNITDDDTFFSGFFSPFLLESLLLLLKLDIGVIFLLEACLSILSVLS